MRLHVSPIQGQEIVMVAVATDSCRKILQSAANKFKRRSTQGCELYYNGKVVDLDLTVSEVFIDGARLHFLLKNEVYRGPTEAEINSSMKARDKVSIITGEGVDIDAEAVEQINSIVTSMNDVVIKAVGMPDLHHGPTGVAILASQPMPKIPGYDIGCGMALFLTNISSDVKHDKVRRRMAAMDLDTGEDPRDPQLGTLGGGNHFAELLKVDESYPIADCVKPMLDTSVLYLLIHSGSRAHGERVFLEHADGKDLENYMLQHCLLCDWAQTNRKEIARRFLQQFCGDEGTSSSSSEPQEPLIDIAHNWIEELSDGTFLHRKGAAPSYEGKLTLLPGSRGTASYVLLCKQDWRSLNSVAHGAGRRLSRTEARRRLGGGDLDLTRGGTVICSNKDLLKEEAPQAYKDVDSVVRCLEENSLCEVGARLIPVATYKTKRTS